MDKKRSTERAIIAAIGVFLFLTVLQAVVGIFFKDGLPAWSIYIYAVIELAAMLIPSVLLFKKQPENIVRYFNLRQFRLKWLPATLLGAICATLGAAMLNLLFYSLPFSHIFKSSPLVVEGEGGAIGVFLAFVLIPAVFEELFIHGALLSEIKNKGICVSVFICAFIFAMLHSSAANFLGPMFAAVIYGFLTVVYNSVWPAIIAHFINNAVADYASTLVLRYINIGMNGYVIFIASLVLLICMWLFAHCLMKQLKTVRATIGYYEQYDKSLPVSLVVFPFLWLVKIVLDILNII